MSYYVIQAGLRTYYADTREQAEHVARTLALIGIAAAIAETHVAAVIDAPA